MCIYVCVCVCVCVYIGVFTCVCVFVCVSIFFYDFLPLFVHCVFFKCVNAHVCASPRRQNHGSVFGAVFCYLKCARRLFSGYVHNKGLCLFSDKWNGIDTESFFFPFPSIFA